VNISYDPTKNKRNIQDRDLSFEAAVNFDFDTAQIHTDARSDFGETRYVALGFLGTRLHVLCFTETHDGIRVISFRKANQREVQRYAKVND